MLEYTVKVFDDGRKEWHLNGKLHRVDGPAVEFSNGYRAWFLNGQCHRVDGPAVEYSNGDREWFVNDEFHRVDGPAIEHANGDRAWYLNGVRHREDGPAVERADGSRRWFLNGKLHRVDGPAVEFSDGSVEWWVNGEMVSEDDVMSSKSKTVMNSIKWVCESRSLLFLDLEQELDKAARSIGAVVGTYVANADAYLSNDPHKPTDTPGHIVFLYEDGTPKYINSTQYADIVRRYRYRLMSVTGIELPASHILIDGHWCQDEASEDDVMGPKTEEALPEVLVVNGVEYRRN